MQMLMNSEQATLLSKVSSELEKIRCESHGKISQKRSLPSCGDSRVSSSEGSVVDDEKVFHVSAYGTETSAYQFTGKYTGVSLDKNNDKSSHLRPTIDVSKQNLCTPGKSKVIDEGSSNATDHKFPPGCLKLLFSLPGNNKCVDCSEKRPEWASVSYGVLLCLKCCGRHRGFGVQVSFVRSIFMDSWSHSQILSMLEGGNEQLHNFFHRHSLSPQMSTINGNTNDGNTVSIIEKRYKTKAAQFYREQLGVHVKKLISNGEYKGRDAARKTKSIRRRGSKSSLDSNDTDKKENYDETNCT